MAQKYQGSLGIITSVVSDGWCDCICYWVYVRKDRLICISEKKSNFSFKELSLFGLSRWFSL